MNEDCIVPEWLHDILLGYGDPAAADYHNMEVRCGAECFQAPTFSLVSAGALFMRLVDLVSSVWVSCNMDLSSNQYTDVCVGLLAHN